MTLECWRVLYHHHHRFKKKSCRVYEVVQEPCKTCQTRDRGARVYITQVTITPLFIPPWNSLRGIVQHWPGATTIARLSYQNASKMLHLYKGQRVQCVWRGKTDVLMQENPQDRTTWIMQVSAAANSPSWQFFASRKMSNSQAFSFQS